VGGGLKAGLLDTHAHTHIHVGHTPQDYLQLQLQDVTAAAAAGHWGIGTQVVALADDNRQLRWITGIIASLARNAGKEEDILGQINKSWH